MIFKQISDKFLKRLPLAKSANCGQICSLVNYSTGSSYEIVERGQLNTPSYRVYLKESKTNKIISPFHDIPLRVTSSLAKLQNETFNMVVEIPRWSNSKMEITKNLPLNPITQDVKKGKLRYVNNVFPHHGYIWNYGALPQTWEDPNTKDELTGCAGDNDPLDVCEIGSRIHSRGSVINVKVIGALGLIDEGEADWKILAIDVNDPLVNQLNDISDVEKVCPELLDATRDWFRLYKIPTGKPANNFAENGKFFDTSFALKCIAHDHASWKNLEYGGYKNQPEKAKGIALQHTTLSDADVSALRLSKEKVEQIINETSAPFNPSAAELDHLSVNTVFYIDRNKV